MSALMPTKLAEMEALLSELDLAPLVAEIANHNAPDQVVLSGHEDGINQVVEEAKKRRVCRRAIPLKVSAPFHCSLMEPPRKELQDAMKSVSILDDLRVPVVSNLDGRAVSIRCRNLSYSVLVCGSYCSPSQVSSGKDMAQRLVDQVSQTGKRLLNFLDE